MIVTRYMTEDTANRIVAHVFEADVEQLTDTTAGVVQLVVRETPADAWGPPRVLAPSVPYWKWVEVIEAQGFTHETREGGDAT